MDDGEEYEREYEKNGEDGGGELGGAQSCILQSAVMFVQQSIT